MNPAPAASAAVQIRFGNRTGREFFTELRDEAERYFQVNGLSKTANTSMWVKAFTLYAIYFGAYGLILSGMFSAWAMLGLCVLMGIGKAGLGFNVAHDAIHGAFSEKKWVNKVLSKTMNLIGGSDYVWSISHNQVHHTFTNIHNVDEDLAVAPFIRLSPHGPLWRIHRFQHIFAFVVYGLATVFWVFVKDYKKISQAYIGHVRVERSGGKLLTLIAFKLLYYTYTIIVPLLVLDVLWWQFMIGFLAMHFTAGIIMGVVFQLAHVVETTEHPLPTATGNIENAWAVHQMETTNNFARSNALITWYVGGLNYQVEHHLFAKICSIHYPALSRITERIARKHGVAYNEHKTFLGAVASHYRTLRALGRGEALPGCV